MTSDVVWKQKECIQWKILMEILSKCILKQTALCRNKNFMWFKWLMNNGKLFPNYKFTVWQRKLWMLKICLKCLLCCGQSDSRTDRQKANRLFSVQRLSHKTLFCYDFFFQNSLFSLQAFVIYLIFELETEEMQTASIFRHKETHLHWFVYMHTTCNLHFLLLLSNQRHLAREKITITIIQFVGFLSAGSWLAVTINIPDIFSAFTILVVVMEKD